MKIFNINNYVRVKLNDQGRKICKDYHDNLFKNSRMKPEYTPPAEDDDGWSKWQMWELMQKFGPHIYLGGEVPFDTQIEILPS